MAATLRSRADRANAGWESLPGNHPGAARSAFDLRITKERRGRVRKPAYAGTPGRRPAGFKRRSVSDGHVDPAWWRSDERPNRLSTPLAATNGVGKDAVAKSE